MDRSSSAAGGVISRRQLLAHGLSRGQVDRFCRTGRPDVLGRSGVYRVAGAPDIDQARAWIAVLTTDSPLSFTSAGDVWELAVPQDGLVHVTRPGRRRIDWPPGVRIHRVRLDAGSVTRHRGLPVTTRLETALDCLATLPRLQARIRPTAVSSRAFSTGGLWSADCATNPGAGGTGSFGSSSRRSRTAPRPSQSGDCISCCAVAE